MKGVQEGETPLGWAGWEERHGLKMGRGNNGRK